MKNNRLVFRTGAVIFVSWNHAFHACNQDCKKSHTVQAPQLGHLWTTWQVPPLVRFLERDFYDEQRSQSSDEGLTAYR